MSATVLRDTEGPSYDQVQELACRAPLDESGIAVLPSDWDDDDE